MSNRYSTYDAKAKFSEILRKVRTSQHVIVSCRGEAVAEIRPVYEAGGTEKALREHKFHVVLIDMKLPAEYVTGATTVGVVTGIYDKGKGAVVEVTWVSTDVTTG
jgi:prevent-host-death family protein